MFESISLEEFEGRTGVAPKFMTSGTTIVSLRDILPETITAILAMPMDYLEALLRNVTLSGDENDRPYAECEIRPIRIDPKGLAIGQTFVQRSKYQDLVENFSKIMGTRFCMPGGIAKLTAKIVYGQTATVEGAIAHYVPPIIERSSSGLFLLDGIHRNFLVMGVGTTIESIQIEDVSTPLPCATRRWHDISVVTEKPPREQRFYDLQPHLFRNLKWTGIDG